MFPQKPYESKVIKRKGWDGGKVASKCHKLLLKQPICLLNVF